MKIVNVSFPSRGRLDARILINYTYAVDVRSRVWSITAGMLDRGGLAAIRLRMKEVLAGWRI